MKQRSYALALLMPWAIALAVVMLVYLPRSLVKPQDEFLISVINPFCHSGFYQVKQQRIVFIPNSKNADYCQKPTAPLLYRYDTKRHQLFIISYDDAKNLALNTSPISPQGLTVALNNPNFRDSILDFMLFRFRYYLIGRGYSEGLFIPITNGMQYSKVTFMGWVRYDK